MERDVTFAFEIIIGALVGVIPFVVLRSPLNSLLVDLCGIKVRAEFWARFTWLIIFLTPILFATMSGNQPPGSETLNADFFEKAARSALLGVLIAVLGVGLMLVRVVRVGRLTPDSAK